MCCAFNFIVCCAVNFKALRPCSKVALPDFTGPIFDIIIGGLPGPGPIPFPDGWVGQCKLNPS